MQQRLYAPIYHALFEHAQRKSVSFHVPGHHHGEALLYALQQMGLQSYDLLHHYAPIMELDLTELSSTDDLHHPEAAIKEAQQLAADCYGADETFFLVGGSTSGNLSLLLAVCDPGDLVIVQRNVHKSVLNGLALAGASAVFLAPEHEPITHLPVVPSIEQVEQALQKYPEAKAVFLTNPNYYGMGVTLEPYAEVCHRHGKPLLVDEAHGAHYGFHPQLPASAIRAGADGVVQSTHKTLPALTMGAMLHIRGGRIDRTKLKEALAMVQSSSPSFPIMASLDISRAIVGTLGPALYEHVLGAIRQFREWLAESRLIIASPDIPLTSSRRMIYDPLRLILTDARGILTGYELQRELEALGCYTEMADPSFVLLVSGPHAGDSALPRLKEALLQIHHKHQRQREEASSQRMVGINLKRFNTKELGMGEPVSFARERRKSRTMKRVPLREAENQLSGEMVIPYPPGIPIVYVGERLTAHHIETIIGLSEAGAKFQGAADESMNTIAILIEEIG
ncbi:aminotransferase class I/II-fold pyridoxal phosphate-dependent enzyme [Paenibacillus nanensis]|uniref:Aminotransferase class I/II-fold pyridoxal phosphate-dependent enzyme n=1 Tax=Paenibacillus nanensis TaxID=393251 RepID=A0A3A1UQQ2_9BACL|nr:aminotransferase class I/II-fold pyridoxal phosphate-dependent enzyme [Paenibacillus nanensis]RIX49302.1 aminotransferase class I/II-fold pyridoxal phosphate-dependent enzyme [Paenibacillus nanensis]